MFFLYDVSLTICYFRKNVVKTKLDTFFLNNHVIKLECGLKIVVTKIRSLKKKISIIFKLGMILLDVSYERKIIICYKKYLKLTKNNIFNKVFCQI